MYSCKITIQRKVGEQWPVVLEQNAAEGSLEIRSEGLLSLDLQALASQLLPRDYGIMLGQALFQGDVRDAFLHARAQSEDRLSVQLFVEAPDLRALHWERLCAPFDEQWHFLMLDQRTPFTLALPSKADRRFPPIERKDLRALVVVACPEGLERYQLSPFPVEETIAGIRTALGDIPYDVLANLPDAMGPPTLDALCERLTTMSYPLLHLVCHGQYIAAIDDTVIYLCKEDQQVDPVVSSRLLERLSQIRGERGLPHFVFLATCESASQQAEGALGGLAQRLVRDLGIPAVLAMTDTVTISTAEALTSTFYQHLSAHGHLDLALSEVCAGLAERQDCTVAALYSRLGAQPLFEPAVSLPSVSHKPPRRTRPRWQVIALLALLILGSVGFVVHAIMGSPTPAGSAQIVSHMTATAHVTATAQADAPTQEKVAVPSYFDPGSPGWTQMENGASTSGLAIINPNSGPGISQDQNYVDTVTQVEKAGILVVGYISTSYAGTQDRTRTLRAVEQDVDNYYRWYPNIAGIFVDEVSTDCGRSFSSYYKPLYDYIKHKGGVAKVILNPGTNTSECYMSAGDIIVNFDDSYSIYVNWLPVSWVSTYPASRFWQIIIGTSQTNMPQAVVLSKHRNAGWVYVTDEAGANPFADLPSYWSNELLLVSHS